MAMPKTRLGIDEDTIDDNTGVRVASASAINRRVQSSAPEEIQTEIDRVASMLGEVATDDRAYVNLSRIERGRAQFCARYTPTEYEAGGPEFIRQEWGPGDYEVRLYATMPNSNYFGVRAKCILSIAALRSDMSPKPQAGGEMLSAIERLVSVISDGQQTILRAIQATAENKIDPIEQMAKIAGVMASMRSAFGSTEQPRSSIRELLTEFRSVRELSEEINPGREPDSLMSQLTPLLELIKTGMDRDRSDSSIPLVALPQSAAPTTMPAQTALPSTTPAQTAPQSAEPGNSDMLIATARKVIADLIALAPSGDVVAGVDVLDSAAEDLSDEQAKMLDEILVHDDWFATVCYLVPNATAHCAYITSVRDMFLTDPDTDPPAEKPAAAP